MEPAEILAIIGIVLVNAGAIIAFAMKMNSTIAELNQRLTSVEKRLDEEMMLTRENLDKLYAKLDEINKILVDVRLEVQGFKHIKDEHEHYKSLHIK